MTEPVLTDLPARLAEALIGRGWVLATAESCTGGWAAKICTDLPGSSAWFDRGYVTYSNAAKADMLDVDPDQVARHGAVSEAVARAMADGARIRSGADVSVAVTGIAGPDGGTVGKPVGTVCFAWSGRGLPTCSETRHFAGNRESIRRQSVTVALQGVLNLLNA